jgi:hypothetical protein
MATENVRGRRAPERNSATVAVYRGAELLLLSLVTFRSFSSCASHAFRGNIYPSFQFRRSCGADRPSGGTGRSGKINLTPMKLSRQDGTDSGRSDGQGFCGCGSLSASPNDQGHPASLRGHPAKKSSFCTIPGANHPEKSLSTYVGPGGPANLNVSHDKSAQPEIWTKIDTLRYEHRN